MNEENIALHLQGEADVKIIKEAGKFILDYDGNKNVFSSFQEVFTELENMIFDLPEYTWLDKWYLFYRITVDEVYRQFVIERFIEAIRSTDITPEPEHQLYHRLIHTAHNLGIILEYKMYDHFDNEGKLRNIEVQALVKTTEYKYYQKHGSDERYIMGMYESYDDCDIPINQEILRQNSYKTTGYVEVVGNSIIVKDKYEQIEHILPADKYIVHVSPLKIRKMGWVWKNS